MIREIKTFRVDCDFCSEFVIVKVDDGEIDNRDVAIATGGLGWKYRSWEWDELEVACPKCLAKDLIGTGWRSGY